jgi:hypothetical protein
LRAPAKQSRKPQVKLDRFAMLAMTRKRKEPTMPDDFFNFIKQTDNPSGVKKPPLWPAIFSNSTNRLLKPGAAHAQKSKIFWPVQNPCEQYQLLGKKFWPEFKILGKTTDKPLANTIFSGIILNMTQYVVISKTHCPRLFYPRSPMFFFRNDSVRRGEKV